MHFKSLISNKILMRTYYCSIKLLNSPHENQLVYKGTRVQGCGLFIKKFSVNRSWSTEKAPQLWEAACHPPGSPSMKKKQEETRQKL